MLLAPGRAQKRNAVITMQRLQSPNARMPWGLLVTISSCNDTINSQAKMVSPFPLYLKSDQQCRLWNTKLTEHTSPLPKLTVLEHMDSRQNRRLDPWLAGNTNDMLSVFEAF